MLGYSFDMFSEFFCLIFTLQVPQMLVVRSSNCILQKNCVEVFLAISLFYMSTCFSMTRGGEKQNQALILC